jgi:hypothetical protein
VERNTQRREADTTRPSVITADPSAQPVLLSEHTPFSSSTSSTIAGDEINTNGSVTKKPIARTMNLKVSFSFAVLFLFSVGKLLFV